MALTFDQFMYGIGYQETRGNKNAYHEVNAYGAVGKYQVLKSNVPEWSRRVLGYSISWQKFRDSPDLQEKIVRGILYGYWKNWGARGAAAAWYAGASNHDLHMSTRPQKGGPSIKEYVDSVIKWAGGATEVQASYAGATGGGTSTAPLSMTDMAAKYGLAADVLKHNKEIRDLVKRAVKEGWDGTLFQAHLKNTKWWRTTSDTQRKYFLLRYEDPATYKQKIKNYNFSINQMAVQIGLTNQYVDGKATKLLQNAVLHKMRDGWSDAQLKAYLSQAIGMHDGEMYGDAGEAYDQIFQLAYQNGLSYSKSWYTKNIRNVIAGKTTIEALTAGIRSQAAAKYYAFAPQIRAGQNVMDLAAPYIQTVAQLLELPVTDVDLHNKYVNKAMTTKVASGAQPATQYPLWQFENDVRSDPLWKKTNNARESMFSVAHQVAKDFGMAY